MRWLITIVTLVTVVGLLCFYSAPEPAYAQKGGASKGGSSGGSGGGFNPFGGGGGMNKPSGTVNPFGGNNNANKQPTNNNNSGILPFNGGGNNNNSKTTRPNNNTAGGYIEKFDVGGGKKLPNNALGNWAKTSDYYKPTTKPSTYPSTRPATKPDKLGGWTFKVPTNYNIPGYGCNGGRGGYSCNQIVIPTQWVKPPYKPQPNYVPPIDYVRVDPPPYVPPMPNVKPQPVPQPDPVPANRLPNILLAQSVRTATDTALIQGEPTPTPTQLADGSVVDTAPHLLVKEASRVAQVTPTSQDATERTLFVSSGSRAPPAPSKTPRLAGLCLSNPAETGAPVSYLLNGYEFTLEPGQVHQVPSDTYSLEFDMGGELGTASYELDDGTFNFRVSKDKGWNIYRKTFRVTMDNASNPNAFNFLLNGKEAAVPAGQKKEFTSKYPIMVSFDPGDSGEPSRRWLTDGTYKVGIDPRAQLFDLYLNASASAAKTGGASMIGD